MKLSKRWSLNGTPIDSVHYDNYRDRYFLYSGKYLAATISGAVKNRFGRTVTNYHKLGKVLGD